MHLEASISVQSCQAAQGSTTLDHPNPKGHKPGLSRNLTLWFLRIIADSQTRARQGLTLARASRSVRCQL